MSLPIPRESIDALCAHRDRALELYAQAFDALAGARKATAMAAPTGRWRTPEHYNHPFVADVQRETWLSGYRKEVDRALWSHLAKICELERLMDKQARDEFHKQLDTDPPEATPDNCYATLLTLMGQSGDIFRRGIANAFSELDRRFKTHDGFKIGSKIILSSAFSEYGGWNHWTRRDETLRDIERTFCVLDGKPHPEYGDSFVYRVSEAKRKTDGVLETRPGEFEDDFFRIVWFKNGNAHLWFKRADLVERVNRLLAEHYGAVVPDSRQREGFRPNREPAKNDGFFETPAAVVERVLDAAGPLAGKRVLEPSAGLGRIAYAAALKGARVEAFEIDGFRAAQMMFKAPASARIDVGNMDFFDVSPASTGLFDAVLMNPPFDKGRDVDHVRHAWEFVKPGGVLVAIMSAGAEFSETKSAKALRTAIDEQGAYRFESLPPGSFKESGTMVNVVILRAVKREIGSMAA